jgi:hypothetical protein
MDTDVVVVHPFLQEVRLYLELALDASIFAVVAILPLIMESGPNFYSLMKIFGETLFIMGTRTKMVFCIVTMDVCFFETVTWRKK